MGDHFCNGVCDLFVYLDDDVLTMKKEPNLSNLIEALTIFLKYDNPNYPTYSEHDILYVCINPSIVTECDIEKLADLGFFPSNANVFESFRYGSA